MYSEAAFCTVLGLLEKAFKSGDFTVKVAHEVMTKDTFEKYSKVKILIQEG